MRSALYVTKVACHMRSDLSALLGFPNLRFWQGIEWLHRVGSPRWIGQSRDFPLFLIDEVEANEKIKVWLDMLVTESQDMTSQTDLIVCFDLVKNKGGRHL